MQIILRLHNFASTTIFGLPQFLSDGFPEKTKSLTSDLRYVLQNGFLIQREGQEEQQEDEQRGGGGAAGQAAEGAAGRAAGGEENKMTQILNIEHCRLILEQFLARIWDPEYYRITRKNNFHKYLLFDLKTVGQNSGSGRELIQEIFWKYFGRFSDQIEDIRGFLFPFQKFPKILLYWYSPAARFVAGHFADQIEDIH